MNGQADISIARARGHVNKGEYLIKQAERVKISQAFGSVSDYMNEANTHFLAAMAITNILLADPAEFLDVIEP